MKLRTQILILFLLLVSLVQLSTYYFIYQSFASFRQSEFYDRLEKKAVTSVRLLYDVKEIDNDLLKIIDRTSINKLFDEKIIILDSTNTMLYSSVDYIDINCDDELMARIRSEKRLMYVDNEYEVLALNFSKGARDLVVLASAYDRMGLRMLEKLNDILWYSFLIGFSLAFLASYYFSKAISSPFLRMIDAIKRVNPNNFGDKLLIKNSNAELKQITSGFNNMLDRLDEAFAQHKNFIHYASHELRNPISMLLAMVEHAQKKSMSEDEYKKLLSSLQEEHEKMANMITSLLMLNKATTNSESLPKSTLRIDELVFRLVDELEILHVDMNSNINFNDSNPDPNLFEINANSLLLANCFRNLIENCYKYSSDQMVSIDFITEQKGIMVLLSNHGLGIEHQDQENLFTPFYRGKNSSGIKGIGLGLSLAKSIIELHSGTIEYIYFDNVNTFKVYLPY